MAGLLDLLILLYNYNKGHITKLTFFLEESRYELTSAMVSLKKAVGCSLPSVVVSNTAPVARKGETTSGEASGEASGGEGGEAAVVIEGGISNTRMKEARSTISPV